MERVESAVDGRWLEVVLARYDGGEPKIGITRCYMAKDGSKKYWKLGRMTPGEAAGAAEAMRKLRAEAERMCAKQGATYPQAGETRTPLSRARA